MPEPDSLPALLVEVPDPRDRAGRRPPLVATLAQACCAVLCGGRGHAAIAQMSGLPSLLMSPTATA